LNSTPYNYSRPNLPSTYLNKFGVNDWVLVECSFNIDKYSSNEFIGTIRKIVKTKIPKKFVREDKAESKRIELLAHTKMSAFDGIASVSEIIERSKDFG
jgi:DNA polymerase-3 subunit alpha (Gram-positive type)